MLSANTFISKRVPGVNAKSIEAVLALQGEGATVPFMARYRKERTGNLDEVQIRTVIEANDDYNAVLQRREFVVKEIEKQGNLTPELKKSLDESWDLNQIEEIYRPYKKKKKSKATLAREAGLTPLADWIWALSHGEGKDETTLEVKAKEYVSAAKGYATYEEVLRGAQHILVEKVSNMSDLRTLVRDEFYNQGKVKSEKTSEFKPHSKYEMYAEYSEPVKNLDSRKASHRYLALRRGWQEGELKVTMEADEEALTKRFESVTITTSSIASEFMKSVAKTALTVHVIPSITNELHTQLKERADLDAIQVFAENVRNVLMSSPFGAKVVLGVDPGLRTGCKVALIDKAGNFISHTVLHIHGEGAHEKAKTLFSEVVQKIKIEAIAVGNGTGGREAEGFIRKVLKEIGTEVPVIMISESGASVYSASDIAREEFPDLDLTVRGAISIARRVQDPLAELVKVEPKSIGVGQYQHDVSQTRLKKSLHEVVESCVNQVGVDLNTASESLLQYVSGIGPAIAKNIVAYRKQQGLYKERDELLKVPQFSTKAFEQAAGFLRIADGKVALDRTGVHPERYSAVREMATEVGATVSALMGPGADKLKGLREKWGKLIGEFTFDDILRELEKPGRDPRDPFKVFNYRDDIHELKDLKGGMICPGIVTNVTNFGAFVDIGVHQDGLVHISELSHQFVDDPRKVVNPGDQVQVKVLAVDLDKNQISLTMKLEEKPKMEARPRPEARADRPRGGGRGDGPRREGRDGGRRPQQGSGGKGGGPRPQHAGGSGAQITKRPEKPAFNNPFAALSQLKK
ncbi:MAG: RNA-binding transcriptional accessory protein [Bdellovibrionales bacterium]|nr:RNA-binding transcriptional accessory protein [Bdellovibrionales bacterium]